VNEGALAGGGFGPRAHYSFKPFNPSEMNNLAASCEVSELGDEIYPKGVTPECFYRGSSSEPAWIPA